MESAISRSPQRGGNRFGDYMLEAVIGQGSMSIVLRARRLSEAAHNIHGARPTQATPVHDSTEIPPLSRPVALKVLRKEVSTNPVYVAHFQHEVDLLHGLIHPNIIRLLEHGVIQGRHYAALEYWPGTTLRNLLQRHKQLPRSHALFVATQIADALAYAYRTRRLVHRDIKPENILVDQSWQIKIIDFSLASYASGCLKANLPVTETPPTRSSSILEQYIAHSVAGTLAYAAPEHLRGVSAIDAGSDIYSLGICLYEMLVGAVPYLSATSDRLVRSIVANPIAGVLAEMPGIEQDMCVLIGNMLHADPLMRYSSWPSVVSSLQAAVTEAEPARDFSLHPELN